MVIPDGFRPVRVIRYQGGKSGYAADILRLLPRPAQDELYIEPFAGTAAIYLALRANGWRGPAILNDTNYAIAKMWEMVHGPESAYRVVS